MDILIDLWSTIQQLSWNAEAVAGLVGASTATATGSGAWWWQRRKANVLPTLPSHAEAMSGTPTPATRFFAAVHDLTMSVTEAWNAVRSRESGGQVEEAIRKDRLRQIRDELRAARDEMMAELKDYDTCSSPMYDLITRVSSSWEYTSQDHYRTETYTVTTTDSDGKTKTETRTRQVYDYSEHWFSYDAAAFGVARKRMRDWLARWRTTHFPSLDLHRFRVEIDRIDPAEKSFLERLVRHTVLEDEEAEVTDSDLESFANQWLLGTRIDRRLDTFVERRGTLDHRWKRACSVIERSDASYYYKTGSRSHSGPPGYQEAQMVQGILREGREAWGKVAGMVETCVDSADTLVEYADDPEHVESDREYAELAVEAYQAAFPGSDIEIDQLPRHGWTVGLSVLGGVLGALASYLLHPMGVSSW